MTKYRPHREYLADSMREVSEVASFSELVKLIRSGCCDWPEKDKPTEENTRVERYGSGIDHRIGWNTHIVTVAGAAWGFTDGPLKANESVD